MKDFDRLLEGDPAWSDRARLFAARVRDYSEYVDQSCGNGAIGAPRPDPGRVAFDDPCHLCHGQQIRSAPRRVLDRIAGLQRVELQDSESCCGSAGIYSLLRPEDSTRVVEPKLEALARSRADTLVTANPGCHLQWETHLKKAGSKVRVMHIAELLGGEA